MYKIFIPAAYAGSPALTLFEMTIVLTCISVRASRQEATCSDAGRNSWSLVTVSSLSKMISSACFIRTRRGSSLIEERSYVGLKREGVNRKSIAKRIIYEAKIYERLYEIGSTLILGVGMWMREGIFGSLHIINPLLVQFLIQDAKPSTPFTF